MDQPKPATTESHVTKPTTDIEISYPIGLRMVEITASISMQNGEFKVMVSTNRGVDDTPIEVIGYNKTKTRFITTASGQAFFEFNAKRGVSPESVGKLLGDEGSIYDSASYCLLIELDRTSIGLDIVQNACQSHLESRLAHHQSVSSAIQEKLEALRDPAKRASLRHENNYRIGKSPGGILT